MVQRALSTWKVWTTNLESLGQRTWKVWVVLDSFEEFCQSKNVIGVGNLGFMVFWTVAKGFLTCKGSSPQGLDCNFRNRSEFVVVFENSVCGSGAESAGEKRRKRTIPGNKYKRYPGLTIRSLSRALLAEIVPTWAIVPTFRFHL